MTNDSVLVSVSTPTSMKTTKTTTTWFPQSKTVTFNEFTTIREIQSLSELSDKEVSDVWYNEEEYTAIKNHVTETMKRVANGELSTTDDDDGHGHNDDDDDDETRIDRRDGDNDANNDTNNTTEWCFRGLEGRTKFGMKRRRNNKARALGAVWSTQVALWEQRLGDNPAIIAAAYRPHSTNAKYPAIARAHKDELFLRRRSK